jgi:hypothetical protein
VDSRPCLIIVGIAEEVGLKLPQTLEADLHDSLGVTFKSRRNKEKACFELASEKSRAFLLDLVVNLHLDILSKDGKHDFVAKKENKIFFFPL